MATSRKINNIKDNRSVYGGSDQGATYDVGDDRQVTQNAGGRYTMVQKPQAKAPAVAAPAKPQFGLENTQSNWVDDGSAEHLVKDYAQRNSGLSDKEKTLDYWKQRAGVKNINRQEDINQIERTMRNREHELEIQRSQQVAAPAAAAAPEAKPFNPADYAPTSTESTTETAAAAPAAKKPNDYLTQTLNSLKANTQTSAYDDFRASLKSRDEKVAAGQIDPLTPANLQDSPDSQTGKAPTAKWAEYAAAFGYGPTGHRIDANRKASSSRFLGQLKNSTTS